MNKILLYLLFLLLPARFFAQTRQVWMVGPMIHFNISEKKVHTSFGFEVAYWNYDHFPYSVDAGIEFEKQKIRLYSEGQTGIGVLGISLGPVLELRTSEKALKFGYQGSGWGNYFGGIDLRFRTVGGTKCFSPGLYFKIPLGYGGSDGDHHHYDWDD